MSSVATSSATEAALLDQISSVVDRIETKTIELQDSINDKLHWLPGPLQDKVVSGWNSFCSFMQRVWDNLNEIISNMGSLSALWSAADAWSDGVGAPVSSQVQSAEAGLLSVDDKWDGDAAELVFDAPQRAVTPGQAAVCYAGELVVGGGTIERWRR